MTQRLDVVKYEYPGPIEYPPVPFDSFHEREGDRGFIRNGWPQPWCDLTDPEDNIGIVRGSWCAVWYAQDWLAEFLTDEQSDDPEWGGPIADWQPDSAKRREEIETRLSRYSDLDDDGMRTERGAAIYAFIAAEGHFKRHCRGKKWPSVRDGNPFSIY